MRRGKCETTGKIWVYENYKKTCLCNHLSINNIVNIVFKIFMSEPTLLQDTQKYCQQKNAHWTYVIMDDSSVQFNRVLLTVYLCVCLEEPRLTLTASALISLFFFLVIAKASFVTSLYMWTELWETAWENCGQNCGQHRQMPWAHVMSRCHGQVSWADAMGSCQDTNWCMLDMTRCGEAWSAIASRQGT